LTFGYVPMKGKRHMFQVGVSSSLFVNKDQKTHSCQGIISKVKPDEIAIMLSRNEAPEWLDKGKIGLDLLFDEATYDQMEKMLWILMDNTKGRTAEMIQYTLGNARPRFEGLQGITYPDLNTSQNEALNQVNAAKDIGLIHGPPGTGKTTTLVTCIRHVLQTEKQVLVCAPSNSAVDLIVEKLHQKQVPVTRLGHPARVTEEIEKHTLDAQITQNPLFKELKKIRKKGEELRRLGKQYKRSFGRAEAQERKLMLQEARFLKAEGRRLEDQMVEGILNTVAVIACTLVGANNQRISNMRFKTVFIDESSQVLEPAAWIAISKAERVIMAGDHLQLAPTVKSKEALAKGFGNTIFERCINAYDIDVMLTQQYRMHPEIMAFSNQHFYQGLLTSDPSILERPLKFERTTEFIDTAGCGYEEALNKETLSTFNLEEASFTINQLKEIVASHDQPENYSYAIIAPYKAQVELLRYFLSELKYPPALLKRISINSVDAFQGQERDIVLISLTRSNAQGVIGFLSEEKRMNVAMTRAKYKLLLIGDSATLSRHSFFDKLIQHYQAQNHYRSAFEFLY
ncbi:AAA domain-containing protein, partial [Cyclobacteriaceae bacterium]|nr:AAA domain-containing protein [Cyclobacteriaceae bacterium]